LVALVTQLSASMVIGPFSSNQTIPDNDPSGLLVVRTVSGNGPLTILDLNVRLQFTGGYNGDLAVTLAHGSGYAVLLNRVGRTLVETYGYTDSGFSGSFRLDDQAGHGDVHRYRLTLSGNAATSLGGPLGGDWAPDGRTTNPDFVLDTDSRLALLSSFNGLPVDGEWSLHVADLAPGGASRLVDWSLEVETTAVPEPSAWLCGACGALGCGLLLRRERRRRER
jgi:subtilisin-like proprotein convertase family protein